jgi:Family of unknown function (DUF6220)
MQGVRRVARSILRYFIPLYGLLLIVQVFLAGEGIFGARDQDQTIDNAKTLDLHRGLGFFLTMPGALLLLIVALLAWLPNKRQRALSLILPVLLFVQMILAGAGRWVAAFHPVNAFLLLGIVAYLTMALWRAPAPVEEPMVAEEMPAAEPV